MKELKEKKQKEKKQSVNFLSPNTEKNISLDSSQKEEILSKKYTVLYFIIGLIIIIGTFFSIKVLTKDAFNKNLGILEPKKLGLFETVRNLFLTPEKNLIGEEVDRINVLLLGIGGPGHEGPYLSDTNIILSIKPSTKEVAMISIPRDLGVKIENYGTHRINYASALGEQKFPKQGGDYARKIFSETFDLEIPYFIRIDFKAFEQIINAVGGIEIDVINPFIDYSYPAPNFAYQTVSFASGTQYMDGDIALKFVRSRHGTNGENSDFARSRRQQQVITSLKDKVLSFGTLLNPMILQKLWESLSKNITTNLDFSQMIYLASIVKNINSEKIINLVLDSSVKGYLYPYTTSNGAFLLAPKENNFNAINLAIANIFNPDFEPIIPKNPDFSMVQNNSKNETSSTSSIIIPTSTFSNTELQFLALDNSKIEIQNGTWQAGLASKLQNKLANYGLNIISIGNSVKRPIEATTIYLINPSVSNELLNYLTKQINGKIEIEIPDWLQEEYDNPQTIENEKGKKYNSETDILIILGLNEK